MGDRGASAVCSVPPDLVEQPPVHIDALPPLPEPLATIVRQAEPPSWSSEAEAAGFERRLVFDSSDDVRLSAEDGRLEFESRFESGNLARATQTGPYEYKLEVRPDMEINGKYLTHWFYFSVRGAVPGHRYRLAVTNAAKAESLQRHGLRPLLYSVRDAKCGHGWVRAGEDLAYYANGENDPRGHPLYTFSFTLTFFNRDDTVYVASAHPYTYSMLQRYLNSLKSLPNWRCYRRETLCLTHYGHSVDVLTITAPEGQAATPLPERHGILVTARVHPSETAASWIAKGLVDTLLGESPLAVALRAKFVFRVVPMLNPDGVVFGQSRCSLEGYDLNRVWDSPSPSMCPTIFAAKKMAIEFGRDRKVGFYVDLHGHSRKMNAFTYGCEPAAEPAAVQQQQQRILCRLFPRLLALNSQTFSYQDCTWAVRPTKEGTARVTMWKDYQWENCFTLEASICGTTLGQFPNCHFNTRQYCDIGRALCQSFYDFYQGSQAKISTALADITLPAASAAQDVAPRLRNRRRYAKKTKGAARRSYSHSSSPSEEYDDPRVLEDAFASAPVGLASSSTKSSRTNLRCPEGRREMSAPPVVSIGNCGPSSSPSSPSRTRAGGGSSARAGSARVLARKATPSAQSQAESGGKQTGQERRPQESGGHKSPPVVLPLLDSRPLTSL
eukprot:m51a1_g8197 hypothetical protein (669) ;mRNA; f:8876-11783